MVEQSPNDEPAGTLVQAIQREKAALLAAGSMKREKSVVPISGDELPHSLPKSWLWVRLGELLTKIGAGSTPLGGREGYTPVGVKFLRSQNVWNHGLALGDVARIPQAVHARMSGTKVIAGDLLFNITGASIGRCALVPESFDEGNVSQHVTILRTALPSIRRFLHLVLISAHVQQTVRDVQVGVSREGLSIAKLGHFVVPLPPLAEQHRIVARVEELMKLCDALEQSGRLADEQHARLTSTLFDALATSESAHALAENWQRVAEHFDLLLDRPEAIDAVEQTILQLAVRGLLVPQDALEGTGADVLKRCIHTSSVSGKRARADLVPFAEEEAPFSVPAGWAWARFGEVADVSGGVTLGRKGSPAQPVTVPYLRVANVQRGKVNLVAEVKTVTIDATELPRFQLRSGDLLITEGGDWDKVGRTCTWREEIAECLHQNHVFKARGHTSEWLPAWGELCLNSADARSYFAASAKQTTILASINMTELRHLPFPLPPVAEQHRIVTRVEELRRLCAELRERLTDARRTQRQLAEALVAQAVA